MLNKCCFIGNVGKDPEIRDMSNGKQVANFSLAVSEHWKDKNTGERKEKTEWVNVVIFNEGLVGVVKNYVKKGHKLYLEGTLQTRKWTDKDGVEKYSTEVVLQGFNGSLVMLTGKEGQSEHNEAKANAYQPEPADLDDEIPF